MTEAEVLAAALSDPDAQTLKPDDFKRMKRTPRVKIICRGLGLTLEEFSALFHIPLGTLRNWEQGAAEPDSCARIFDGDREEPGGCGGSLGMTQRGYPINSFTNSPCRLSTGRISTVTTRPSRTTARPPTTV